VQPDEGAPSFGTIDDHLENSPAMQKTGTVDLNKMAHKLFGKKEVEVGPALWQLDIHHKGRYDVRINSSGSAITVTSNGRMCGIDRKTGGVLWDGKIENAFSTRYASGPDGVGYVTCNSDRIVAFDEKNGELKNWEFNSKESSIYSPLIIEKDVLFFTDSKEGSDGHIYALNGATGEILWKKTQPSGHCSYPCSGPSESIYVTAGNGKLYALDKKKGVVRWAYAPKDQGNLSEKERAATMPVTGPQGEVCYKSMAGSIYMIDGKSGKELWTINVPGISGEPPVIGADGTVYITRNSDMKETLLLAIDGKTGQQIWAKPFKNFSHNFSADTRGNLCFVNIYSGELHLWDAKSGVQTGKSQILDEQDNKKVHNSFPVLDKESATILLASDKGIIHALDVKQKNDEALEQEAGNINTVNDGTIETVKKADGTEIVVIDGVKLDVK